MSIVSERTRHSDAICIAASKVTLERPRSFSRDQKRLRWSRGRERERGRGREVSCDVPEVAYLQVREWRVVILVHR